MLSADASSDLISIATFITALATLATIGVLIWQTKISKKTLHGEFTLRLHDAFFFNSRNEKIIRAIEGGEPILKKNGGQFIETDLDDYLGIIELLAIYIKDGTIKKKTIDDMFGYYIVKTWSVPEIKDYVTEVRTTEKDDDFYSGLQRLAEEF